MIYKLKGTLTSSIFIVLILLVLSLLVITPMLNMVILGAIFAYGVRPISHRMEPFLKFRSVAIVLAMVIVILPLIFVIIVSVNALTETTPALYGLVKNLNLTNLNATTAQQYIPIQQYVPAAYNSEFNSLFNAINIQITDILRGVLNYLLDFLQSIPVLALQLLIFFASTFYFARDGEKLWKYVEYSIPDHRSDFFKRLFKEIERVLKSIFFGHFLTAIIIGVMAGVGFFVLGYPYAAFLGIIAGFLQLIPVIGPWPTYTALVIYDFFVTGNIARGIIVLLFGFFLSGSDIYIRPKLSGKYADIHPLIFLLGFLCGPLIFGLVGFIIGPLILGVTYAAVVAYRKAKNSKAKNGKKGTEVKTELKTDK